MVLPANLAALVKDVASADPCIRDDLAYPQLAALIKSGQVNDEQLTELGYAMVHRLHHPQIQARTFAPLILARVAAKDVWHQDWTSVFLDWWVGEVDLRGYDEHLGWLHAVAHGADCAGQLGMRQLADPSVLLDAVAARMVTPTEYVWRDQEEDRMAACICAVLWPATQLSTRWMDPIGALFAAGELGPVPPNASNTMRTLRSLYVALCQCRVKIDPFLLIEF